jgi:hypothetical protein
LLLRRFDNTPRKKLQISLEKNACDLSSAG